MGENSNNGMQVENPLEMDLIFADGVYVSPKDKLHSDLDFEDDSVLEENNPMVLHQEKVEPLAEDASTITTPAISAEQAHAVLTAETEVNKPEIPVKIDLPSAVVPENVASAAVVPSKPVRVLIRFSDGLFEGDEKTRELVKKFFSIITKNGKVLDENYYELIDVPGRNDPPREVLLKNALRILVFGVVEHDVCDGLRPYEVRVAGNLSVVQFPSLSQIMESTEAKQKFALALKKFFGQ